MAARKKILVNKTKPGTKKPAPTKKPATAKKPAPGKKPATAKKGGAPAKAKGEPAAPAADNSQVVELLEKVLAEAKKATAQAKKNEKKFAELEDRILYFITLDHDAHMQKKNEMAMAMALAFTEISEEAGQQMWEAVPTVETDEGDVPQVDQQNLMSGPDGEQNTILLYEGGGEEAEADEGEYEDEGEDEEE
jgi:hypothetical protein